MTAVLTQAAPVADTGAAPASGHGALSVQRRGARSVVSRAVAASPLRLLTPSNHGHAAWIYTSTFGGGLVDGDDVRLDIEVGEEASAYVSSQASTKVYRSPRGTTNVVRAHVGASGLLVMAPDAVVPFAGARYRQTQRYDIAAGASLVVVDMLACGRMASDERWRFDACDSVIDLRIDGRRRVYDAVSLRAADGDLAARCGRFDVLATAVVAGAPLRGEIERLLSTAAGPVSRRADQIVAASAAGPDACVIKLAGTATERAVRTLRELLDFVPERLADDPWIRKW